MFYVDRQDSGLPHVELEPLPSGINSTTITAPAAQQPERGTARPAAGGPDPIFRSDEAGEKARRGEQ
jgi:hypothetical protein